MGGRREGDQQSHECRNTGVRQHGQRSTRTHLAMRVQGPHSTHMPRHTHGSLHTQAARVPHRHAAQRHANTPCAGSAHHAHAPPRHGAHACRPPPPRTAPGASHGLARPRTWRGGCLPRTDCISQWRGPARPRMGQRALAHACTHMHCTLHMCVAHLVHAGMQHGQCGSSPICRSTVHTCCTHAAQGDAHGACRRSCHVCTSPAHVSHTWCMHGTCTCTPLHMYAPSPHDAHAHPFSPSHIPAPHYICVHIPTITHV